eukprot:364804-Chlamydomonas_euryale.AAC.13
MPCFVFVPKSKDVRGVTSEGMKRWRRGGTDQPSRCDSHHAWLIRSTWHDPVCAVAARIGGSSMQIATLTVMWTSVSARASSKAAASPMRKAEGRQQAHTAVSSAVAGYRTFQLVAHCIPCPRLAAPHDGSCSGLGAAAHGGCSGFWGGGGMWRLKRMGVRQHQAAEADWGVVAHGT